MRAAFAEYESVLSVPSSAMWERSRISPATSRSAALSSPGSADEPVGSGRFELREDFVYIGRLSVLPAHRGHGIGEAMMLALEQRGLRAAKREAHISVRVLLERNIALYERLGYTVTARYQHERGKKPSSIW